MKIIIRKVGKKMSLYELGHRIRKLRENRSLTREQFCNDETELSVRHLARIEKGDVLPSLTILSFIAKKFQVDINELIDSKYLKKYNTLKVELELLSVEMNEKSEQKAEKALLTILTEYYEIMPYDEKMYIECTLASYVTRIYQDITYAKLILEKYEKTNKNSVSYNEYAYYALYVWIATIENRAINIQEVHKKIAAANIQQDGFQTELIIRLYINIATYYLQNNNYQKTEECIDRAMELAKQLKTYKRLPLVYMMKAKCLIQSSEINQAKENYRKAIDLCDLLELKDLNFKIIEEYKNDIENFKLI